MEPTRRPATTLLSQGTVLEDRYEILRISGRGGMSTVYAARDLRFRHVERLCAIKEMNVAAPDNQTRVLRIANFEQEAALLATLSHPAIPTIFDFFSDGSLVYLVLEFIEGQNLESFIENSTSPPDESLIIDWAIQILEVLSYLHEHQPEPIVFRDMKPSNVMIRPDKSIALIDFGIARTFQPLQKGTMIGTEGYAPPEQYRGIAEPRGDLYALGATLHHLATGVDPRTETPFTFEQRPVRTLNSELSRGFEEILNRALAYSAADRYPSAAAMSQALQSLQSIPHSGGLTEPFSSSSFGHQRRDTTVIDAFGLPPEPKHELPLPDGTLPIRERVLWNVQTGDEVRGSALVSNRRAYIGSYDGYLYAIGQSDGVIAWRFRSQRGIVARPVSSGDSIVVGSEDQNMYSLRVTNGRMLWSFRTAMAIRSSAVLFDDAIVFGSDDGYCYCIDVFQGQLIWRQRTWGAVRSSPIYYQDSIVVGSDDGAVYRISASDGRVIWRAHIGDRVLSSPAIESGVIVVGNANGSIYGISFESGNVLWQVETQRPVLASPRILGDVAYVGSSDGAIYAVRCQDGAEIWRSQIANQVTSTVAMYSGYGYVGTVDGFMHCLTLRDGETVWRHRVGGPITSTPAIGDGVVIFGSLDGRIYGMRL